MNVIFKYDYTSVKVRIFLIDSETEPIIFVIAFIERNNNRFFI